MTLFFQTQPFLFFPYFRSTVSPFLGGKSKLSTKKIQNSPNPVSPQISTANPWSGVEGEVTFRILLSGFFYSGLWEREPVLFYLAHFNDTDSQTPPWTRWIRGWEGGARAGVM